MGDVEDHNLVKADSDVVIYGIMVRILGIFQLKHLSNDVYFVYVVDVLV